MAAAPILQYVYDTGFVSYRLGYASAISYAFLALIIVFPLGQLWLSGRRGAGQKGATARAPSPRPQSGAPLPGAHRGDDRPRSGPR